MSTGEMGCYATLGNVDGLGEEGQVRVEEQLKHLTRRMDEIAPLRWGVV